MQTLDHQTSVYQIRVLRFPLLRQLLRLGGQARYLRICLCQREIVLLQLPSCSWLEFCSRFLCKGGGQRRDLAHLPHLGILEQLLSSRWPPRSSGLPSLELRTASCGDRRLHLFNVDNSSPRSLVLACRLCSCTIAQPDQSSSASSSSPSAPFAAGRRDLLVQVLNLTDQLCPVRLEVRLRLERPVELLDRWHIPVALFPTEDLPRRCGSSWRATSSGVGQRCQSVLDFLLLTLQPSFGPLHPGMISRSAARTSSSPIRTMFQKRVSSTPGWVHHVAHTKLRAKQVKTTTVCQVHLRLKALAHPHDACIETRVPMTDVQLRTTRKTDISVFSFHSVAPLRRDETNSQ